MTKIKKFIDFINEDKYNFGDIFPPNKWVRLSEKDREDLKDNLFYIIDKAYGPLGGHVRIKDSDSISSDKDLTFWRAIDIDDDKLVDIVIFGKAKNGFKISGWGHDGLAKAKKELMIKLTKLLRMNKFWIEVSGKPAKNLLINSNVPYINSEEKINKLFPNSNIKWFGEHPTDVQLKGFVGFYKRILEDGSDTEIEIVLGNPII